MRCFALHASSGNIVDLSIEGISSVITEVYLTILDHPCSVCVACKSVVAEIYFSVLIAVPPSVLIVCYSLLFNNSTALDMIPVIADFDHSVILECNLTVCDFPGSELVGCQSVVAEVYLAVLDHPPSVLVLRYGIHAEINFSIGIAVPPSVLVVCYGLLLDD